MTPWPRCPGTHARTHARMHARTETSDSPDDCTRKKLWVAKSNLVVLLEWIHLHQLRKSYTFTHMHACVLWLFHIFPWADGAYWVFRCVYLGTFSRVTFEKNSSIFVLDFQTLLSGRLLSWVALVWPPTSACEHLILSDSSHFVTSGVMSNESR